MSGSDYLYAAGVVRHLENKLLNPTDIERMVDAPDLEAAFKVFHDTDYFDNVLDVAPRDFLKALDADLLQAKQKIQEMVPNEDVVTLLFMRFDFHNLKLLYKAKMSGQDLDQYASPLSQEEYTKLKSVIIDDEKADLKDYLATALEEFNLEVAKQELTPSLIDRVVDQSYFRAYQSAAKAFKSSFIYELVKRQIDVANIKIFIRAVNLGLEPDRWSTDIISGGTVEKEAYKLLAGKPLDDALAGLASNFSRHFQNAILEFLKHKSLDSLERDFENVELEYIRQAKYMGYGPELPVAYFFAKWNAIKNVRLIMTGKQNDIKSAEIKGLIRDIY
ncbi:V-type ATPase subunit [Patescibacteria group bacterium]|nr:V-type ATPase subunit [Patescibacteria group bacterium]